LAPGNGLACVVPRLKEESTMGWEVRKRRQRYFTRRVGGKVELEYYGRA